MRAQRSHDKAQRRCTRRRRTLQRQFARRRLQCSRLKRAVESRSPDIECATATSDLRRSPWCTRSFLIRPA
ncbi:hypothetical protein WT60_26020 [Burkholderia sp. MSMB617WGS]|uniref:Uncharacterized protein n=1 Tax=Burkholderia savannae TaxID=1637837 RepID=A0ABR5T5J6_9BURK|nr:hypothetical protein WS78_23870 [Burkholderia savannae]AOK50282.1 hypothetical protein WT60_26020 [Burkholderia sp. MSMB617WGS]KVG37574.1 hypothetical protein WS77_22510 [Burkholderia sp. MSMB0265]KVG93661.1 hypothetical protein WS83_08620 [Burkholderia sp. MSMB2042]KVH00966.1 hypothetical protein WS82_22535 [Burkholderia sp. MSMB2041]KVK78391.1 hypothetical protein WS91_15055 [Burkholderia sp. MSMB1498]